MIFVDSNVPMYLVGADHPNKRRVQAILQRFIESRVKLVTDVEVFQEILHRYTAIRRHEAIGPAWTVLEDLTDEVFPLDLAVVDRARQLLLEDDGLSVRDAVHVAVMRAREVETILSFDSGFDRVDSIRRVC